MPIRKSTPTRRAVSGLTVAGDESELTSPVAWHSDVRPPAELDSMYRGEEFGPRAPRELESVYYGARVDLDARDVRSVPEDPSQQESAHFNFAQPPKSGLAYPTSTIVPKKSFSFIQIWPKRVS